MEVPEGSHIGVLYLEAYSKIGDKYKPRKSSIEHPVRVDVNGYDALQKTYLIFSGEPAYELGDIRLQKEYVGFLISIWTFFTNPV